MGWILIFLVVRLGAPKSDRLAFLRSTYSFVLFPLEEPHAPRLGLALHAALVVGTGLPAVLEQRLMPDKRMSSQYEDSDLYSTPNLIRRDILKEPERPRARPRRPPPMAAC